MQENTINSRQFGILLLMLILGSAFIFVPEGIAGRDTWLATIIASLAGLYVLSVIIILQKIFPGMSIIKISTQVLGKPLGFILGIIYTWLIFFIAVLYLYNMTTFLLIIFPGLSDSLLNTFIVLTIAYVIYNGLNSLSRLSEILIWIVLALVIPAIAIPFFTIAEIKSLTPVLSNIKAVLVGGLFAANWPYGEIILMAMLLPAVNDLKQKSKIIYIWFFIGVILFVLRSILATTVLWEDLMQTTKFPLYEVLLLIRFSTFQRVELFFFIMWSITNFMAVLLSYQSLVLALKDLFSLRSHKTLIIPAGLAIAVFPLIMFPSSVEFLAVESFAAHFHNIIIQLLYPTIILAAAKIKQRKSRNPLDYSPEMSKTAK
ncbi:endospore germination permease [Thermosyntropha sp.]|uniref:GerAB/ArcD/ProY family transporter n=1 Tax=Thermosyntropha sp. TaxID=2740820 RepID=UPI0025CC4D47|nr:endospore germination permease [Thermosyntropha sp.]MBO8159777.1 endospore germination permease [Thermosyntropha sp.]